MTPESKVKAQVKKVLQEVGAYYAMPVTGGYGVNGTPDFIVCLNGLFIGIECKAKQGRLTQLQQHALDKIKNAGGRTYVVNESGIVPLRHALQALAAIT